MDELRPFRFAIHNVVGSRQWGVSHRQAGPVHLMSAVIVAMTLGGSALVAGPNEPVGAAGSAGPAAVLASEAAVSSEAAPGQVDDPPYQAPLAKGPQVLTPFSPPAHRYGRGHLGIDLVASAGDAVLAAGDATVRFAGPVAGRGVVVLAHPDGVNTVYEPVAAVVAAGQRVLAGQRIGVLRGWHRSCAPATCLHWGARRGEAYLDPMSLLRPLGVVRLLPWS